MEKLTDKEKDEFKRLAASRSLKSDLEHIRKNRRHPLKDRNGLIDPDRYIQFASEYNEFINHEPRKFRPFREGNMKM